MGHASLTLCDLCGQQLDGYIGRRHQTLNPKNGLCITVGYSLGGWGQRKNHIEFSGEVCIPCYERIMPAVRALKEAMGLPEPRTPLMDALNGARRRAELGRG